MKIEKIIMKEKTLLSVVASKAESQCLNSCKTDLPKLTWVEFGKSEFLKIYIFNWYKGLNSA